MIVSLRDARHVVLGADAAGVGSSRVGARPAVGADEQEVLDVRVRRAEHARPRRGSASTVSMALAGRDQHAGGAGDRQRTAVIASMTDRNRSATATRPAGDVGGRRTSPRRTTAGRTGHDHPGYRAPSLATGSRCAQVDDVAGVEAVGDRRTRRARPAGRRGRTSSARPIRLAVGAARRAPAGRAWPAPPGTASVMSAGSASYAASIAASTSSGSMPSPSLAAPSGAQPTFSPMPTTTYAAGARYRRPGPARRPACVRRAAGRSATSARRHAGDRRARPAPRPAPPAASARAGAPARRGTAATPAGWRRRRVPAPVEAAAASGLVRGHQHAAIRRAGGRRGEQIGVRAAGLVDDLDVPSRGHVAFGRCAMWHRGSPFSKHCHSCSPRS